MWIRQLEYSGDLGDAQAVNAGRRRTEPRRMSRPCRALRPRGGRAEVARTPRRTCSRWAFVPGRIEILGSTPTTLAAAWSPLLSGASAAGCRGHQRLPRHRYRRAPARVGRLRLRRRHHSPAGHWANYPMSVVRRIARNFAGPLRGANVAFASDLPPAARHEQFQCDGGRHLLALAEIASWPPAPSTARTSTARSTWRAICRQSKAASRSGVSRGTRASARSAATKTTRPS